MNTRDVAFIRVAHNCGPLRGAFRVGDVIVCDGTVLRVLYWDYRRDTLTVETLPWRTFWLALTTRFKRNVSRAWRRLR